LEHAPITGVRNVVTPAPPSRQIITGYILNSGVTNGIKGSKDAGTGKVTSGNGQARRVIIGSRDSGDTGSRNVTAGNSAAIKETSIGRGVMAGNGTFRDKSANRNRENPR